MERAAVCGVEGRGASEGCGQENRQVVDYSSV